MADSAGDPVVGATLAGYRIERRLGRGGMSVVYLAEDLALGRKVALKILAPELSDDPQFRERFRLESRLAASIDHPNVIPIYEAGEAEGQLYIAMRYVEGTDLRKLIDEEGALEPTRAVAVVARVADGLEVAHERGLVHRDVKPSNVLIASPGEHVYLADFGLTKTAETEEEARQGAQLSGTTDYVAPELITEGGAGPAADVYALGCVLYESLTGQVPFPRSSELETLVAHIDEPPPKPSEARPELPSGLDAVVERAMAKDAAERYASAAELAAAARAALPEARGVGLLRTRRRLALFAAALAVLIGLALIPALILAGGDAGPNTEPTLALASGALQRIDLKTNELVATIRLGGQPADIAAGADAIWLVDTARNALLRVDAATSVVTTQGSGIGDVAAVAAGPGYVGVAADGPTGGVAARIDPRSLHTIEVGLLRSFPGLTVDPAPALVSAVADIAGTTSAGWLVDAAAGTVLRVGRIPPAPRVTVETGGVAVALATAGRREVWVASRHKRGRPEGSAVLVDEQGIVKARVVLPFLPSAIASGKEGVWVSDPDGRKVWRIDSDGAPPRSVGVDGRPLHIATGAGSVWVLTAGRGTLVRIDPNTFAVVATTEVGTNPSGLAVGEGSVWVALTGGRPRPLSEFPMRYGGPGYPTESVHPATPRARCGEGLPSLDCLVIVTGRLRAKGNILASVRFAWREQRRRGGSVVCQGKRRNDPVSSEVRGDAGTGRMTIEGWGTVAFNLDRMVYTYRTMRGYLPGGDLCGEQSGTWVGIRGAIIGVAGTFTTRGPYNTLILAPSS